MTATAAAETVEICGELYDAEPITREQQAEREQLAAEDYLGHRITVERRRGGLLYSDGKCYQRANRPTYTDVLIDGRRLGDSVADPDIPALLRKARARVDQWADDERLLPRLVELVDASPIVDALSTPEAHEVGDVAYVYAMGRYRRGVVVKVARARVTVAYTTASSRGRVFRKAAPAGEVLV